MAVIFSVHTQLLGCRSEGNMWKVRFARAVISQASTGKFFSGRKLTEGQKGKGTGVNVREEL